MVTADQRDGLYLRSWINAGVLSEEENRHSPINLEWVPAVATVLAVALAIVGAIVTDEFPKTAEWFWQVSIPGVSAAFVAILIGYVWTKKIPDRWQRIRRSLYQALSMIVTLIFGVGLPAAGIFYFGGLKDLLEIDAASIAVFGRVLQLFFIAIAVLTPALLFYLFDRLKMATLRERFYRQMFRLDPDIRTLRDVAAKYGQDLDEAYGLESRGSSGRLLSGTRWPILVATLVFAFGWMITLLPVGTTGTATSREEILGLFVPEQSAMVYAFLGAYFFSITTALRGFARGDLRPKAYVSFTVRVFVVVILAWVVDLLFEDNAIEYRLALAFTIGVFPEIALTLIRENLRFAPGNTERFPLTGLEGLDAYDRARLMDEGVTNVEALAHHELVDLMLQTRIPTPRLVDWIDQAILALHIGKDENKKQFLSDLGIRAASDLEEVRATTPQALSGEPWILPLEATMRNDEWMNSIRYWRLTDRAGIPTVSDPAEIFK